MSDVDILYVAADSGGDAGVPEVLRDAFHDSDDDVHVHVRESIAEAEAVLDRSAVNCLVTDYELPDGTGLDLISAARSRQPDVKAILFTAVDPGEIVTVDRAGTVTEFIDSESPDAAIRLARLVRTTVTGSSHLSYPRPPDDEERLAALRTYDLESERLHRSLDRITDLATRHFDVPSSSINVLTEHEQYFLGCQGRATSWEPTARANSICTFTILEDDGVLVVEDVTEDPRFEHQPQLLDDGVRSYLGTTLVTPDGYAIGTLCVYDDDPRAFSEVESTYLETLADLAMDLISVHTGLDEEPQVDTDTEDLRP